MKGLLQKFQNELTQLEIPATFSSSDFAEEFAVQRFLKKFQVPLEGIDQKLHLEAWDTFLSTDNGLVLPSRVDGLWYKVRCDLHSHQYHISDTVSFPKGSEFYATRGFNSIEARLARSVWTVTHDCFDDFAKVVYGHKALKRAYRERYNSFYRKGNFSMSRKESESFLYKNIGNAYEIFKWKLSRVVTFEYGSRFSTVPKNNSVRRPINIECFGNMIVQKGIGDCFRELVKTKYGNDLSHLQDKHKLRLQDGSIATIDLKNASDSINMKLIEFLLPASILKRVMRARSEMILGPDNNYYPLRKISSMGNGFTFELMTLILTSLCRVLDPNSSVYGDDIIICKTQAPRLIEALENVGFSVNIEKSFIDGPFRESCGGNYHDDIGYIESFDFKWPESLHDCVTFYNKARILERYAFFENIVTRLDRVIPPALRGPDSQGFETLGYETGWDNRSNALGGFFRQGQVESLKRFARQRREIALRYQYDTASVCIHYGFRFTPDLRTQSTRTLIRKRHWAKYEMYLHSGSVCKDVTFGIGRWDSIVLCTIDGRTSTLSSLIRE